MKKFLLSMASLMLLLGSACNDDDDKGGGNLPSVEVSEVSFSEQDGVAKVEVKPSENTETWYWKCTAAGEDTAYTSVTGNAATTLDLTVTVDVDYVVSVYAENADGKSDVVTKDFKISSAELEGELVEFTVKNLTAFSLDVDVKKSIKCSKYVIGAQFASAYNEQYFIESAENSLNPNPDYPMQPFNWSDESATFSEHTLTKGTLADDPESRGFLIHGGDEILICVYALPADGSEGKVFTESLTVPEPSNYDGSIEVQIDIADEDITLTSVAATITAGAGCKKIFTSLIGASVYDPFDEITDEAKQKELLTVLGNNRQVLPYTEPYKVDFTQNMGPNETWRLYAVPIAEDGTIGKVTYKDFTTKKPVFEGTGKIVSAELTQTIPEAVELKLSTNNDVEKVRIFCWSYMECNVIIGDPAELEWVMYDRENNSQWTDEYAKNEFSGTLSLRIPHPGDDYCIYGATVDAKGNVSYPVNLVQLAMGSENEKEMFKTMPEEQEEIVVKFDGTGEVTFKVTETSKDEYSTNIDYTVTKGANTVKAYRIRTSDTAHKETLEEELKTIFADYPNSISGSYKELTFADGDTESETLEYLVNYDTSDSDYGGNIVAIVTVDKDGKLKIADYYLAGTGDKE
ncbi:MAG: hypothetical protein LUH46_07710 [Alistipes sp.]|nr:hypothetical protein [Alistipes sp.]